MPEEIIEFIRSFVQCGCPLKSVLEGMVKFSERPTKKQIDELKELLKDLPIKFEED